MGLACVAGLSADSGLSHQPLRLGHPRTKGKERKDSHAYSAVGQTNADNHYRKFRRRTERSLKDLSFRRLIRDASSDLAFPTLATIFILVAFPK